MLKRKIYGKLLEWKVTKKGMFFCKETQLTLIKNDLKGYAKGSIYEK